MSGLGQTPTSVRDFNALLSLHRPPLEPYEELYKLLHANPELSLQECATAELVGYHLEQYGYTVTRNIGGHGVIGVLTSGPGRTILVRADTDALPIREETGLDYASKVTQRDAAGVLQHVMHSCGHDMHTAAALAAARTLSNMKNEWSGTVVFLFQPDEEGGRGAHTMVADGLYEPSRHGCPKPDVLLAQHIAPFRAGTVSTRRGVMAPSVDSFTVTLRGKGSHAAQPHLAVDPVVLASYIVVRLQGIVSREVKPGDLALVTVGSIQAGSVSNIIPEVATMKVTIRTDVPALRDRLVGSFKRITRAECDASGAPEPIFEPGRPAPFTVNDEEVTKSLEKSFAAYFAPDRYLNTGLPLFGSEDFPNLAIPLGAPYCYWTIGCIDPKVWDEAEQNDRTADIPVNHSPHFAPAIQPTLETGVDALVVATLTVLRASEKV